MNENEAQIDAKLVISGAFECRDKDGVLLKTIVLNAEVPLNELKEEHDDQRSE